MQRKIQASQKNKYNKPLNHNITNRKHKYFQTYQNLSVGTWDSSVPQDNYHLSETKQTLYLTNLKRQNVSSNADM